ncbi:hypothetical protein D3C80_1643870 [compost metagenome]
MFVAFTNALGGFRHTHQVHLRTLCARLCRMVDEHRLVTDGRRHPKLVQLEYQGLIACDEVGQFIAVQALFGIGLTGRTRAQDWHADANAVRGWQRQTHGNREAMSIAQRLQRVEPRR